MPLFVKGHGRFHQHAVFGCPDAMQHRGDVPMVAKIVRASSIDRDGGNAGDALRRGIGIGDPYVQDFDVFLRRDKGGDFRAQRIPTGIPLHRLPHQPCGQAAFVLLCGEPQGFLFCRNAGYRPAAVLRNAPKIPRPAVRVQVLRADRLQQKGFLVQLAVAPKVRRDCAFQPRFTRQREIQAAVCLWILKRKGAAVVQKMNCLHHVPPFTVRFSDIL